MNLIDIERSIENPVNRWLYGVVQNPLEKMLSIDTINEAYRATDFGASSGNVFATCLATLNIDVRIDDEDIAKIPKNGPLVVVANHPFGGLEGIIMGEIVSRVRPDVRLLGNYLLLNVPELRDIVIPVDPFGAKKSSAANIFGLKKAIKWLKEGGVLGTFPAGEVSHFRFKDAGVTDPPWSRHIAAVVRHSQATVIPLFFEGRNSSIFQIAGLLHPRFRTILLPRELMNKRSLPVTATIGRPIPWQRLERFPSDEEMMRFLRINTYFLKHRNREDKNEPLTIATRKRTTQQKEPVAEPVDAGLMYEEIAALPSNQRLLCHEDLSVWFASAGQIPAVIQEIGRLREVTFREIGEGTGKSVDIDAFDASYLHLFLWNDAAKEIIGAYRLGRLDTIMASQGAGGLYSNTLFSFKKDFFQHIGNAIELGRSFIRIEYQKQYNCLSLLWKGIGEYLVRNPQHRKLFGPVSISNDYHHFSKRLMVHHLKRTVCDAGLSQTVKARKPWRSKLSDTVAMKGISGCLEDIEDVSFIVSEIENDGKGVPVLLRHYLKMNATVLSFNVDKHFSNVLDGLIVVDLERTDPRLLRRFMGKEGYERFASYVIPSFISETAENMAGCP